VKFLKKLLNRLRNRFLELADLVLDRVKVAFVPGEAFGLPRYARFSFALGDDDLREGINRLASFVNS
jgi:aspartate/methionine/tyrosine aminotransferase